MCPSCISCGPPSRHIAWRGCNRQADYTQGCRWPLTWKSNFQATTIDFPSPPYTMSLLKSAHNFAPFSWCAGMSHADKLPSAAFKPRLLFLLSLPAIEQTVFADESLLLFLRQVECLDSNIWLIWTLIEFRYFWNEISQNRLTRPTVKFSCIFILFRGQVCLFITVLQACPLALVPVSPVFFIVFLIL